MELFGYVCSPLCKAKADSHGIAVPVFERQKLVMEARFWRRIARVGVAMGCIILLLGGFWVWYAFWGSQPRATFSVRFERPSYSGETAFAGPEQNQVVFLHGGLLARYTLKPKKELWSRQLVDTKNLAEAVENQIRSMEESNARLRAEGSDDLNRIPSAERMFERMERTAAASLHLYVRGQNVFVSSPGKLTQYSWETGSPIKEIPVPVRAGGVISRGDELVVVNTALGNVMVTSIDLTKGESRTEELGSRMPAVDNPPSGVSAAPRATGMDELAGLPLRPSRDMDKSMDPAKVADQAQRLSLPERLSLPAVLSSTMTQERALREMRDTPRRAFDEDGDTRASVSLIPSKTGFVRLTVRLLETRMVEREAMKPAPTKSALDGPVSTGNSTEVANEILNEMQRSRGGGKALEDLSRYAVNVQEAGGQGAWTGQVIGRPRLYPMDTVNVVVGHHIIHVLDKSNRELWQNELTYNVNGLCVERKGTLYVIDEGVLTAFDVKNGTVRWRLPSVGITGVLFDDNGSLYLNTTTAGPDSIKYSRQINISDRVGMVVMKVSEANGQVMWTAEPGGLVSYVSRDYVYTAQVYMPPEPDEDDWTSIDMGSRAPAYTRIRRINPRTGSQMWEHFQPRAALDIAFDENRIRLVFKKEVQVLEFLSL